jgi:hypothetical protein
MFLRSERGRKLSPRARDVLEELTLVAGVADTRRFADGRIVAACYIGVASLAERLGAHWSPRTTQRALAELVAAGIVTRSRSYRMNSVTVLEIPAPPPRSRDVRESVRNATDGVTSHATDGVTNTEEQRADTTDSSKPAAAAGLRRIRGTGTATAAAVSPLAAELAAAGIGEPVRSELAATSLTPETVRNAAAAAAATNRGSGWLVVRLRELATAKNTARDAAATNAAAAAEWRSAWGSMTNAARDAAKEAYLTKNPWMRTQTACVLTDLPSFRHFVLATLATAAAVPSPSPLVTR